jgi:protein tyrosine phosphatase (PTP) superfamily phosphohydrolase (DUF442 family)
MFYLEWSDRKGATRGTPRGDQARQRCWPILALAASMAFFQSGCQSGPFGECCNGNGLFGPCGYFSRMTNRVFNRSNGNGCCGPGAVTGVPIESGAPSAVVVPGAVPAAPPGATVITPPTGSSVSSEPNILDQAAPKSRINGSSSGGGAPSSGSASDRTGYQTAGGILGTRMARRRSDESYTTTVSTPAPTSRSEQAASTSYRSRANAAVTADPGPLDHLPPLDLPAEVTQSPATSSDATNAEGTNRSGDESKKSKPDGRRESSPSESEVDLAAASSPAPESGPSASTPPGLARFVAVDLKLAGGSVPSSAGLKWLVEKGYRTLLDLRDPSEVPSSFIAEVTRAGLRYVPLPIGLNSVDREHVGRFNFELAAGEARPLYFFDSDGNRPGALWYIRRVVVDRVDTQIARREAEELGLKDEAYQLASTNYVASVTSPPANAKPVARTPAGKAASLDTGVVPSASIATEKTATGAPTETSPGSRIQSQPAEASGSAPTAATPVAAANAPATRAPLSQAPAELPQELSTAVVSDPAGCPPTVGWRPFAAMVVTGVCVPLAFWSRTIAPSILTRTRASLAGSGPRRKSLPGESGV